MGFYTEESVKNTDLLPSLFSMAAIDVLVGSICVLVFVLNELWSDKAKTKIVYRKMPSDTVFSDIASGKIDATGFDLETAQKMYTRNKNRFENVKSSLDKAEVTETDNYSEYKVTSRNRYMLVCKIDNTLIYASVEEKYKDNVTNLIKRLGYIK